MSEQALRTIQEAYSNGTLRPNVLDQRGLSLLHYAAYDGQLLCVKCLINYGADIHARFVMVLKNTSTQMAHNVITSL